MPETERPDEHEGHAFVASGSHAGRPGSWLAVIMILIGFTVGGVGLCLGPSWILIGVGIGLMVIGGVIAMAVDIFSDVIVDSRRDVPAQEHHSPFERHRLRIEHHRAERRIEHPAEHRHEA
ncbi:MAG: HGxxPAAW family protein [Actinomycetes bacterium]|jgi:hypothetical protein